MTTPTNLTHIRELSSIRGIAALLVLFGHVLSVIQWQNPQTNHIGHLILDLVKDVCNGPAAVEIFFVLSGLVLALSLERRMGEHRWVQVFYIKRLLRIYPALWVSLILALIMLPWERGGCVNNICTDWGAGAFNEHYTNLQILLSFAALYVHLNNPIWSLRTELFYSLMFPLIYLSQRSVKWRIPALFVVIALAVLPIPRLYSVHYALAFTLGALIPFLRLGDMRLPYRSLTLCAFVILVLARSQLGMLQWEDKTFEVIEMTLAFVVVCAVYHRKVSLPFLRGDVLFYLGEISFSLYLLHYPLLFALFYSIVQLVGSEAIHTSPAFYTLLLGGVTLPATLALSALNYACVEKPFQTWGHSLARRISARG